MKESNATRKAPEFSGSISCQGLAGEFVFAYLPGLAGQMKNQGQFSVVNFAIF